MKTSKPPTLKVLPVDKDEASSGTNEKMPTSDLALVLSKQIDQLAKVATHLTEINFNNRAK
jgi:hypothetical protein